MSLKCEGNALVVDRADFNDHSCLDAERFSHAECPHQEKLHIVERYRCRTSAFGDSGYD
jgi:hypothetical protein